MLTRLDQDQEGMKRSAEISTEVLNELKKKFESNLESIKVSFDALNERVLAIGKWEISYSSYFQNSVFIDHRI